MSSYRLFEPFTIGKDLVLKNRIVMSPLTRARSDIKTRVPNALNELYYEQRAGAGLIISEATAISEQGYGWYGAPALYNEAQMEGWKRVTDRVHAKGGKIFFQMWHLGRQSHPSFHNNEVVSASAIGLQEGRVRDANGEHAPYAVPRALETDEIAGIVEDYRKSAALAMRAGFDGVEVHAANGYLLAQFLQSVSNKRTDRYGGSIENRARMLLEVVEAVKTVVPSDRIGVRFSPNGGFGGMGSEDNVEQYKYAMEQLSTLGLGYVAILDGFGFGYHGKCRLITAHDAKTWFKGTVIANNSYTRDIAEGVVRSGAADAVGFGRLYISNPDLAQRFEKNQELNPEPPYEHYYTPIGEVGYTDYPAHP